MRPWTLAPLTGATPRATGRRGSAVPSRGPWSRRHSLSVRPPTQDVWVGPSLYRARPTGLRGLCGAHALPSLGRRPHLRQRGAGFPRHPGTLPRSRLPASRCDFQLLLAAAGTCAVRASPLVLPIDRWWQLVRVPAASDAEHLSMRSPAICTASWVTCLFQSFAYLQVVLLSSR